MSKRKTNKAKTNKRYGRAVSFKEGYTYPLPAPDINWKLRYNPQSLTQEDCMVAASILSAYYASIFDTQKKRNYVFKELARIIDAGDWYPDA